MAVFVTPDSDGQDLHQSDLIKIFLAGTIDNGVAPNWQQELFESIHSHSVFKDSVIFSPRRKEWDQNASGDMIQEQVLWELERLESSDYIFFNFLAGSKSPITLWELGHFGTGIASVDDGMLAAMSTVACPEDYWRYTNVKVCCDRYSIPIHEDQTEAWDAFTDIIKSTT